MATFDGVGVLASAHDGEVVARLLLVVERREPLRVGGEIRVPQVDDEDESRFGRLVEGGVLVRVVEEERLRGIQALRWQKVDTRALEAGEDVELARLAPGAARRVLALIDRRAMRR